MATGTNGIATVADVTSNLSVSVTNAPTNTKKCPAFEWWDPQTSVFVDNYSAYSTGRLVKYSNIKVAAATTYYMQYYNFIDITTYTSFTIPIRFSLYGNSTTYPIANRALQGVIQIENSTANMKNYMYVNLGIDSIGSKVTGGTWSQFYVRLYNRDWASNVITVSVTNGTLQGNTTAGGEIPYSLSSTAHFYITMTTKISSFNFQLPLGCQQALPTIGWTGTTTSVYMLYSPSDITDDITSILAFTARANSNYLRGCVSYTSQKMYIGNFSTGSVPAIPVWMVGFYYILVNNVLYTMCIDTQTTLNKILAGALLNLPVVRTKTIE